MKQKALFLTAVLMMSLPFVSHADDVPAGENAMMAAAPKSSPVEKRITELHAKLKITKDQEALWKAIAQEMRDEGKAFQDAIHTREGKADKMTAVEDLVSYQEMAALHADSLKKFLAVFTPLYSVMSNDQKANADQVFREHKHGKKKAEKQ